jgi:nucleotide-binding universal stress UspA family protein
MFKRILIPTDGSPVARKAINAGIALAKLLGASVVGYTAVEPLEGFYYEGGGRRLAELKTLEERNEAHARRHLAEIEKAARRVDVACEVVVTRTAAPHQGIIATARKKKCDLIFMSSHGRGGFASLLLGSVSQKVLAHSKVPVTIYR